MGRQRRLPASPRPCRRPQLLRRHGRPRLPLSQGFRRGIPDFTWATPGIPSATAHRLPHGFSVRPDRIKPVQCYFVASRSAMWSWGALAKSSSQKVPSQLPRSRVLYDHLRRQRYQRYRRSPDFEKRTISMCQFPAKQSVWPTSENRRLPVLCRALLQVAPEYLKAAKTRVGVLKVAGIAIGCAQMEEVVPGSGLPSITWN